MHKDLIIKDVILDFKDLRAVWPFLPRTSTHVFPLNQPLCSRWCQRRGRPPPGEEALLGDHSDAASLLLGLAQGGLGHLVPAEVPVKRDKLGCEGMEDFLALHNQRACWWELIHLWSVGEYFQRAGIIKSLSMATAPAPYDRTFGVALSNQQSKSCFLGSCDPGT